MDDQTRKALELALEAIDELAYCSSSHAADDIKSQAIGAINAALSAPAAPVAPADLVEAVDRVLAEAPCECGERLRFDRGEHLSGCYLFDLNEARNRASAPAAPVAQCTNGDRWNCKYCRKTAACEAIKDHRNFGEPAPATPGPKQRHPERSVAEMQEFTELEDATGGVFAAGAIAPAPAAPVAQPLTDEQIDALPWGPHEGNPVTFAEGLRDFARAIERAHGIGQGGAA